MQTRENIQSIFIQIVRPLFQASNTNGQWLQTAVYMEWLRSQGSPFWHQLSTSSKDLWLCRNALVSLCWITAHSLKSVGIHWITKHLRESTCLLLFSILVKQFPLSGQTLSLASSDHVHNGISFWRYGIWAAPTWFFIFQTVILSQFFKWLVREK